MTLQPLDGIDRVPVDSSALASIGYSAEREVLAVEFRSGLILHYQGVSAELASELVDVPSLGRFYASRIRGKFAAQTMTGPCHGCGVQGPIGTACACGDTHYAVERIRQEDVRDAK